MIIKNKKFHISSAILFIFVMLLSSCRFEVPIKEMGIAKSSITSAIEVKAEKYAPEDLKKAKDHLFKCHEYIKDEDSDNAKEEAMKALKFAENAISKSLPPLAKDTLEEAVLLRDEAIKVFAEKYAPEELGLSSENIASAENLINELKFRESYQKSMDAIVYGREAKEKALSNTSAIRVWMSVVSTKTDNLESNRGNEFASEEISKIRVLLNEADGLLDNKKLKEAFPEIEEAEEILRTAELKVLKGTAADQIVVAEESLQKIKDSRLSYLFKTEIEKASALTASSKGLFDQEDYEQSKEKSMEAINLLNSVFIAMEKKAEEKRLEQESHETLQPEVREYVVKLNPEKRDCLWRIAYYMYKDARLWPIIYMANKDKIKDPDLIFPGQKFIIPPVPEKKEKEEIAAVDGETPLSESEADRLESDEEFSDETAETGDTFEGEEKAEPEAEAEEAPGGDEEMIEPDEEESGEVFEEAAPPDDEIEGSGEDIDELQPEESDEEIPEAVEDEPENPDEGYGETPESEEEFIE